MTPEAALARRVSGDVRSRLLRALLALALVASAAVGVSVGRALLAPGTDSAAARLAEWGRGHGLSAVIDALERVAYSPPRVGGVPVAGPLARPTVGVTPPVGGSGPAGIGPAAAAALPPVPPLAAPALAGEGSWQVLARVRGRPALQVAYLRPDAVHTSYTAALAWMDTSLLRFVLHPGSLEPGGSGWAQPPVLTSGERTSLVGSFNGGFRLDAAHGGFFEAGRTAGQLRTGAASLVLTTDGRAMVGQWGRDVRMGPGIAAVRQNLDLLVDGGVAVPGLDDNVTRRWGATVGNRKYVWRSGVGQTASGALVYAAGDRLSVASLAELLRRAGAVRAMELDINTQWTSYVVYPAERNLLPDMHRSPQRYDTTSTRDFVAVLRRSR